VVAVGAFAGLGLAVAELLSEQGVGAVVVDPRWVKPIDETLVALAGDVRLVVTLEDNGREGGVGATYARRVAEAGIHTPVRVHGVPQEFPRHATRAVLLKDMGLTAPVIADDALVALRTRNSQ